MIKKFLSQFQSIKMSICKAIALDGSAKGKACFRPASDNGYCLKHQRNMLHDTGLAEGHKWCRMFTRGCNNQLPITGGPTCEDCLIKKRGTVILCKHTGCKFNKSDTYDPYCEVHSFDFLRDEIEKRGKRPCKNFNRGCRVELDIDFKYKACDDCRTKEDIKHKELVAKRADTRKEYEIKHPGKSLCVECFSEFTITNGPKSIPLQRCDTCHIKQIHRESVRAPTKGCFVGLKAQTPRNRTIVEPEITIVRKRKIDEITIIPRKKFELNVVAPALTDDVEWKLVPPELVQGFQIEASKYGELRYKETEEFIKTHKGSRNSRGGFSTFQLNGKTTYVHRVVFWAHSGLPVKTLQHGSVVFKSKLTEGGVIDGMLTNRYEDLMFQPSKDFDIVIPKVSYGKHPLYGKYMYGHWYTVYAPMKTDKQTLFTPRKI